MRLQVEVRDKDRVVFSGEFDEFPILIGRAKHCHISLASYSWVSALHATITGEDDTFLISDMNSKMGLVSQAGKPFLNARFDRNANFQISTLQFTVRRLDGQATVPESPKAVIPESDTAAPMFVPPKPPKRPAPARDHLVSLVDSLMLETPPRFQKLKPNQFSLQGVLVWGEDILDVRQFRAGDKIWVGGDADAPVYLPGVRKPILLGRMNGLRGQLSLTKDINWRMRRNGVDFTPETAQDSHLIKPAGQAGQRQLVDLNHGDFVTLDLGNSVALHLRYVENARFFIRRTWIENREEFVKAMSISLVLHAIAAIALVITAPKTVAPQIENVPPRFAKLLVEPPPMPFAPPKPEPIPEPAPVPEPQPIVEAKPEPPPKPVPRKPEPQKKPIKQVKKTHEKPKIEKVIPPKVVQKQPVAPQPVVPQPVPQKVEPPKPSASEVAANELMDVFSKVPSPASAGGNKAIKIDRSVATNQGPAGQPGISTLGVSGALKAKGGKLQAGGGMAGGVPTAKAGQFGYSNTPGGSKAGKRGVAGGVVGTPKLDDFSVSTNGLSDKEIMSVVNKYLSQVNRCYERALLNDSNLAGRVQYEWDITPDGKVTSVRIKRSELSNGDSLNSCVMLLFKAMKFPAAKNKQPTTATIGFPFGKEG